MNRYKKARVSPDPTVPNICTNGSRRSAVVAGKKRNATVPVSELTKYFWLFLSANDEIRMNHKSKASHSDGFDKNERACQWTKGTVGTI